MLELQAQTFRGYSVRGYDLELEADKYEELEQLLRELNEDEDA